MKRLKVLLTVLMVMFAATIFFACNEKIVYKDRPINVSKITIFSNGIEYANSEDYDKDNIPVIEMFEGEERVFTYEVLPSNATTPTLIFSEPDKGVVTVEVSTKDKKITLTAQEDVYTDANETLLSLRTEDGTNLIVALKIVVVKATEPLNVVQNVRLKYIESTDKYYISWDALNQVGIKGYILNINGEEQPITSNTQTLFTTYGQNIVAKVRAVGVVDDLNRMDNQGHPIYSDSISFKILEAPQNLAHNNTNISWSAVSDVRGGYNLYIQENDQNRIAQVGNLSVGYVEEFANVGHYNIKMKALGDEGNNVYSSVYSEAISFERLATPIIEFNNSVASWDTVVYADHFLLVETDPNGVDTQIQLSKNSYAPNYSNYIVGEYTYKVMAVGDGISALSSEFSQVYTMRKLEPVVNLSVENGRTLVWDSHLLAHSYSLNINGKSYWSEAQSPQYNFDNEKDANDNIVTGTYVVYVIADGNGTSNFSSNASEKVYVTKLAKPEITTITDGVIHWTNVPNANTYEVYIDGASVGQNFTYESGYAVDSTLSQGAHHVAVRALSYKQYDETLQTYKYMLYSQYSSSFAISKLSQPNNFKVKDGILVWDKVTHASGYSLKVNGESIDESLIDFSETKYKFDFAQYGAGAYTVAISAIANGNNILSSNFTTPLTVIKLQAPTISFEGGELKLLETDTLGYDDEPVQVSYTFIVKDVQSQNTSMFSDIAQIRRAVGDNQTIQVSGMASANGYIYSNVSSELTCTKLGKIQNIQIEEGILTWDHLDNATSYNIKFIGDDVENIRENGRINKYNISTSSNSGFTSAGTWQIKVSARGNSASGGGETLYMNGDEVMYSYNNDSYVNILSIITPNHFGVTDYTKYINAPNMDNISGKLFWGSVKFASGYKLKITKIDGGQQTAMSDVDVGIETSSTLSFLDPGTYKIAVYATGNNINTIMQKNPDGLSYKTSNKLTICKLEKAQNITVQNGIMVWDNPSEYYNKRNSNSNIFVAYLALINGQYYSLNNFASISADEDTFRENLMTILTSNRFEFDQNFASGSYSISVYSVPLNYQNSSDTKYIVSEPTDAKVLVKRGTPESLKIENGVVSWSLQVESGNVLSGDVIMSNQKTFLSGSSADYYELTISHNNLDRIIYIQQSDFQSGEIPHFDFYDEYLNEDSIYHFDVGTYSFSVRMMSIGKGDTYYLNSDYSNAISTNILDSAGILKVTEGVLSWDAVEGAESYQLKIGEYEPEELTELTYDLILGAGQYNIQIKVNGNGSDTLTSIYSSVFVVEKLATPANLRLENGIITYDEVQRLSYYNVIVQNETLENLSQEDAGMNTKYELGSDYPEGKYAIRVQAMGNTSTESGNAYINSQISNYLTNNAMGTLVEKYSKVSNIQVSDGVLSWSPAYASGGNFPGSYILNINGIEIVVNSTMFTFRDKVKDINGVDYLFGGGTTYTVDVKARGTNVSYLNGDYTGIKKEVIKLPSVENITVNNGVITWTNATTNFYIGNVLNVEIRNDNNFYLLEELTSVNGKKSFTYILPKYIVNQDYSTSGCPNGDYTIKFVNKGDSDKYITSDDSATISVHKLDVPVNIETHELAIEHFDGEISDEVSLIFNNYDSNASHYKMYIKDNQTNEVSAKIVENCSERYFYITLTENDIATLPITLSTVNNYVFGVKYFYNEHWNDETTVETVYIDSQDSIIKEICVKMSYCQADATSYYLFVYDEDENTLASINIPMEKIYKNYISHYVVLEDVIEPEELDDYTITIAYYTSNNTLIEHDSIVEIISNKEDGVFVGFDYLTNSVAKVRLTITNNNTLDAQTIDFTREKINTYFSLMNIEMNVAAGDYMFSLQAIGNSKPINFENAIVNSDVSEEKQITKPEKPTLVVVYQTDTFTGTEEVTGEVVWEEVENVSGYFIEYKYMNYLDMQQLRQNIVSEFWYDQDSYWNGISWIRVDVKNVLSYHVGEAGYYIIRAVSYLNDYGLTSETSEVVNFLFSAFNKTDDTTNGGSGTEEDPYIIDSVVKLMKINYNLEAHFILENDLTLENSGVSFSPIASNLKQFNGVLDGQGYTISGLTINTNTENFGLFAYIGEQGVVKNIKLENFVISSGANVGLVAIYNYGTIANCIVDNSTIDKSYPDSMVCGGIVAYNYGAIEYCINNANINPSNASVSVSVGGIAGINGENATITFCGNNGNVSGHTVGGIAAYNNKGVIVGCYNRGSVSASAIVETGTNQPAYAGGIVGYNTAASSSQTTISFCQNTGSVDASTISAQVAALAGGIVAYTRYGFIMYCYSNCFPQVECSEGSSSYNRTGFVGADIGSSADGTHFVTTYYSAQSGNPIGAGDKSLYNNNLYEFKENSNLTNSWKIDEATILKSDLTYKWEETLATIFE